jgi:hypothetical protein
MHFAKRYGLVMARIAGLEKKEVASALVLRSDAQDVWKRSYACDGADAFAGARVGRHPHGSRSGPEAVNLVALHSTGKNPRRGAHRLSFLSRYQFCRGQKSRLER